MHEPEKPHPTTIHHELLDLFDELTFREKVAKVRHGLKAPKDSGDYKYARLQLLRLLSPLAGIVTPFLLIGLLVVLQGVKTSSTREYVVEIMEPETIDEVDEIEDIKDEPIEPPEPMDFTPDVTVPSEAVTPSPAVPFSPQPAAFDSVAIVRSPVVMRGMYGSRTPGQRGVALQNYGGSGYTEAAVLRALRWLKHNQNTDGSWATCRPAMTGLALLTFLAHGETPSSEEFGETVEKAILWLINNQQPDGTFAGRDGNNYSQPIATYAMCEAYALTKVPTLKEAAEKALAIVIRGQHPSGGWDYNCKQSTRDDTSYMGWCAQSIKAAVMAGLKVDGLDRVYKNAVAGFEKNAHPEGGFGYTEPARGGLTGVGVLCMQLLGAANKTACVKGLALLENATFNWSADGAGTFNQNYYWYYITQAKFHAGDSTWKRWNDLFAPVLVKNQTVIKDVYKDHEGKVQEMGWWDMTAKLSGHTDGPVMNTALCALQLQVYYRYLPTFKKIEPMDEAVKETVEDDDIDIEIRL